MSVGRLVPPSTPERGHVELLLVGARVTALGVITSDDNVGCWPDTDVTLTVTYQPARRRMSRSPQKCRLPVLLCTCRPQLSSLRLPYMLRRQARRAIGPDRLGGELALPPLVRLVLGGVKD